MQAGKRDMQAGKRDMQAGGTEISGTCCCLTDVSLCR